MNKKFIGIIDRMGYKVLNENDISPIKICDVNGNIVNNKVYKVLDENKRYILVNRFNCNRNQKISIYSNGIMDIKVNPCLSIIVSYNEENKMYSIRLKVNNNFSKTEKNMIIDICTSKDNNEPGFVHVYENNIIDGETIEKELGSLEQKRAYFTLNGKANNMYSGNYTVDNYLDAILHIICSDNDVYFNKNLHDGIDLIIPALYNCLDELLVNWIDNLEVYRERTMMAKKRAEEELSKLEEEVIQYSNDISAMDFQIERIASLKNHRHIYSLSNMYLID